MAQACSQLVCRDTADQNRHRVRARSPQGLLACGRPPLRAATCLASRLARVLVSRRPIACAASAAEELSPEELRSLWDSIPRPLLTIGRKGAEDSHANSLRDLLAAHLLVKAKFTGVAPEAVDAQQLQWLATNSGGVLLQRKGVTFLFAQGDLSMEEIRARGSANVARKEGRADHRETMRVQRRAGEPELGPIAEKALKELVRANKLMVGKLDKRAMWAIAELPDEEAQREFARRATPNAASKIENMSAWITSLCKNIAKKAGS
eukprot:jgi/Tetstr1/441279/TSEL_029530.t1